MFCYKTSSGYYLSPSLSAMVPLCMISAWYLQWYLRDIFMISAWYLQWYFAHYVCFCKFCLMQFCLTLSSPIYSFLLPLATLCFHFLFASCFLQFLCCSTWYYYFLILCSYSFYTASAVCFLFAFSLKSDFLLLIFSSAIYFSSSFWFNTILFPPPSALPCSFFCWPAGWFN